MVKFSGAGGEKQWTKQMGTYTGDAGRGIAIDKNGNLYVTGITIGGLDGNTNAGSEDLFLIKYDSSGNKQWTKQLGTSSYDAARGIITDSNSNVYIAGSTKGGLDGQIHGGGYDLFVVKYDSSGNKQWTKQMGTSSDDAAYGITSDSNNNVYLTGVTHSNLDGNSQAGGGDLFVVKYDSSGDKQWTKQTGSSSYDRAESIATDNNGNLYLTGYTEGNLDGNGNAGGEDIFLMKLK